MRQLIATLDTQQLNGITMRKSLLLFLCYLYSSPIFALNPPVQSPSDIVGCWERIDFSKEAQKKVNEIEPWPIRYQWYCFESDGYLHTMGSTKHTTQTSATLHDSFKSLPKETKYTIPQKGIILTVQNIPNSTSKQSLTWGANFTGDTVIFDGKTVNKGALIMSLYNKEKQKNVYYRYLVRVK